MYIPKDTNKDLALATKAFMKKRTGKFNNYIALPNALVYRRIATEISIEGYNRLKQDVICIRINKNNKEILLANSSLHRASFAFWRESPGQILMRQLKIPMLPFASFTEAGLKIKEIEIIDQSGSETVNRHMPDKDKKNKKGEVIKKIYEDTHFTGASLFKTGGKYFLFDIDREEIKHSIFNAFIVEIPYKVESIADAYDALIPDEVGLAMEQGTKVLRQGEYFFIRMHNFDLVKADKGPLFGVLPRNNKEAILRTQGNRDHICSMYNEQHDLVSGTVRHAGREHANLVLDGWYKAVPNTAVKSFTLTGDVD